MATGIINLRCGQLLGKFSPANVPLVKESERHRKAATRQNEKGKWISVRGTPLAVAIIQ